MTRFTVVSQVMEHLSATHKAIQKSRRDSSIDRRDADSQIRQLLFETVLDLLRRPEKKQADLRQVLVVAGQISEYFSFRNAFVSSDIEPVLHRDHIGS